MKQDYTRLLERQVEILLWFASNTLRMSFSLDYYLVILESFYDKIRDYHMELAKIESSTSDEHGKEEMQTFRKILNDWDDFIPKIAERILEIRSKQSPRP
ncbi:MAG: hypothetical protein ACFFED_09960 [Candidatus Thorarchaeota archaeon]